MAITNRAKRHHLEIRRGKPLPTRVIHAAALLTSAVFFTGCQTSSSQFWTNISDYGNLRNSFLAPNEVGRFDKARPWGNVRAVRWPILEQLDVVDEVNDRWTLATEPLPGDLVEEAKEYAIGEGDQLRITFFELVTPGVEYVRDVEVNELGMINLQNLDRVSVTGLTPSEIEQKLGQLAVDKGIILGKGPGNPGPQVTVTLLQSHARIFSILGLVGRPGTYNIIGQDFRLLDAIALAGDISGGSQPGMDYVYVIRPVKNAGLVPATKPAETATAGAKNPLETLEGIEKPATAPATFPATQPTAEGPKLIRPIPVAVSMAVSAELQQQGQPQSDLDKALMATPGAAQSATQPARVTTPATTPATLPAESLNNQDQYIFVDGKWVLVGGTSTRPGVSNGGTGTLSPSEAVAAATGLQTPRVLRIDLNQLKEGNPKYNILIRPGDIINVPNIEPGEFYVEGHVNRPGVYSITGRKVTLKQVIAAAGNLDSLAIPRRCDLIRRVGNQEVTVQVNLQAIFDGDQPDIYVKANDTINVGTDAVAPFLAVMRNAYRASYGFGFTYDQNLYTAPGTT